MADDTKSVRTVATNRKARHLYNIEETVEAGIVLVGTEVKSLRAGNASLVDSYAEAQRGEILLLHLHIPPYEHGSYYNVDPLRPRKLLLHKQEIRRLIGSVTRKGYTLVPLRLYFKGNRAKVELALARGKKTFDKRHAIQRREQEREMERALKHRRR